MLKTSLFVFLVICLLFPIAGHNLVYAQAGGQQPYNDHIETAQAVKNSMSVSNVIYLSTSPFIYAPNVTVDRFSADGFIYEVSVNTKQIVHFEPISDNDFLKFSSYKMNRDLYKPQSLELIRRLDPGIVLGKLLFQTKIDDGYFRWEDTTKEKFPNGQYPSIQVVYAPDGRLFSYTNTLYLDPVLSTNSESNFSPLVVTTLNAPGSYFTPNPCSSSPWYDVSGGYGYGGSDFCYTMAGSSRQGKWQKSISGYFYTYAYIPNFPGTFASMAWYETYYNWNYSTGVYCNQNLHKNGYCTPITEYLDATDFGYTTIDGASSSSSEMLVADEMFIYP